MVGDRMVGSWSEVKWGTRSGRGNGVHGLEKVRRTVPGRRQSPRSVCWAVLSSGGLKSL